MIKIMPQPRLSHAKRLPTSSQLASFLPPSVYTICQMVSLMNSPMVSRIYCGHSGALKLINLGKNAAKNNIAFGLDKDTQTPVRNKVRLLGLVLTAALDSERGCGVLA